MAIGNTHQWAFLPGDKFFFGQGFKAKNIGTETVPKGHNVVFRYLAADTNDTYIHVREEAAAVTDTKRRVAGMVFGADIEPGGTGVVCTFGRVQTLLVTGTCSIGSYLRLSGTKAGAACQAATASRFCFAIARAAHSGTASGIEALIVPWRI